MMGGNFRLKHVERRTEINCETLYLVGCTVRIVRRLVAMAGRQGRTLAQCRCDCHFFNL